MLPDQLGRVQRGVISLQTEHLSSRPAQSRDCAGCRSIVGIRAVVQSNQLPRGMLAATARRRGQRLARRAWEGVRSAPYQAVCACGALLVPGVPCPVCVPTRGGGPRSVAGSLSPK